MRGFEGFRCKYNAFSSVLLFAKSQYVGHSSFIRRPAGHDPAQGIPLPKRAISRPIEYGFKNCLVCFLVHSAPQCIACQLLYSIAPGTTHYRFNKRANPLRRLHANTCSVRQPLGSRLIDQSQKMTAVAIQIAEKKV